MYVHGHNRTNETTLGRFSYLPLPTIDPRDVASGIRRVLVVEPLDGLGEHVVWARRMVAGQPLMNEATQAIEAFLAPLPEGDSVLRRYITRSREWATVTPVVLPWGDMTAVGDEPRINSSKRCAMRATAPTSWKISSYSGNRFGEEPMSRCSTQTQKPKPSAVRRESSPVQRWSCLAESAFWDSFAVTSFSPFVPGSEPTNLTNPPICQLCRFTLWGFL